MNSPAKIRWVVCGLLWLAGCSLTAEPTSGIEGYVTKGPVTPVCVQGVPCSAPFVGLFGVYEEDGRAVTQFRTQSDGWFEVRIPPGVYYIQSFTTDNFLSQPSHLITVSNNEKTNVLLEFDTGIR